MKYLDTNIFLRALVKTGNPVKRMACQQLFRALKEGQETATTCEAVITEIVYVLSSKKHYSLTHEEVRTRVAPLLNVRGLRLPHKILYARALDLYSIHTFLDFEDAICIVNVARQVKSELWSYDTKLDRVPGLVRREPEILVDELS